MTLLDVVGVILVLGLLLALIGPLLGGARERARRMQCSKQLSQIGLACHGYADAHGMLPPGSIGRIDPLPWEPAPGEAGWSWQARLLPWLDLNPLFDSLNGRLPPDHLDNRTVIRYRIEHHLCPSNPEDLAPHYAGIHDHRVTPIHSGASGCFPLNRGVPPAEISDGLASTLMVSEVTSGVPGGWVTGGFSTLRVTAGPPTLQENRTVRTATPWLRERMEEESKLELPSGRGTPTGLVFGTPAWPDMIGLGAPHDGRLNGLFADGSVRLIGADLDVRIWAALGTRSGRELISDF
jgi:prepilin-type processing-associated H-X9-DG protein